MIKRKEEELFELIQKHVSGSRQAFSDIVHLISSDVLAIAYRYLNNIDDAKDVLQEVSIKLYRKLNTFSHQSKVSTWIYRVVVNTSIDLLRKRKKTVEIKDYHKPDNEFKEKIIDDMDREEKKDMLLKQIEKLPARQKDVVILKHFQGLTILEISKILGCSVSSIKTHLYRAIDALKNELGAIL